MNKIMLCSFCGKEIKKSFVMYFCPYCDNLLLIDTGKNPWHPFVSVISSIIFTPFAGALVAAINLRKLGQKQKANAVVIFILLLSTALAFSVQKLPANMAQIIVLSFYTVLPLFFWLIQKNDFQKWKRNDSYNIIGKWQTSLILSFAGMISYLFIFLVIFSILNVSSSRTHLVHILHTIGLILVLFSFWYIVNKMWRWYSQK